MKHRTAPLAIAAFAGLALSATASAQYGVVNNLPGTFTEVRTIGTAITSGDDSSVAFTSSVTNALLNNTTALFACTNGFISNVANSTYTNSSLPFGGVG